MKVFRTHVAGVDVHKNVLVITVLRGEAGTEPEKLSIECQTFTEDLQVCGQRTFGLRGA